LKQPSAFKQLPVYSVTILLSGRARCVLSSELFHKLHRLW